MEVKYDVQKYITSVRMSSKKRILVEGRDDRSHVKNLLEVTLGANQIKIDTAENIKGDCNITKKNNRAKIEKIHMVCKSSPEHKNIYFLCDREFRDFDINDRIIDLMGQHKTEGNLSWTLGHSLENYFIDSEVVSGAYRYLTKSEYKTDAVLLFRNIIPSALKILATISLAASEVGKCSYPLGVIAWDDFKIEGNDLEFDVELWRDDEAHQILIDFKEAYRKYRPVVEISDNVVCARVCRGHTAIQLLQRVFSLCLFNAGCQYDEDLARKYASSFSKIKEGAVSTALCEAWLKAIENGNENYPINLLSSLNKES